MSGLRVLTVRQPWAWAIVHGGKDVENRPRNLAGDYRGPLAIHAGKTETWPKPAPDVLTWALVREPADAPVANWGLGVILGVVDLIDVHGGAGASAGCSAWAEVDRVHLVLANPRPLKTPIPFKGALHLQTAPEGVEAEIVRQMGALA